jgi:hypothetical protein
MARAGMIFFSAGAEDEGYELKPNSNTIVAKISSEKTDCDKSNFLIAVEEDTGREDKFGLLAATVVRRIALREKSTLVCCSWELPTYRARWTDCIDAAGAVCRVESSLSRAGCWTEGDGLAFA